MLKAAAWQAMWNARRALHLCARACTTLSKVARRTSNKGFFASRGAGLCGSAASVHSSQLGHTQVEVGGFWGSRVTHLSDGLADTKLGIVELALGFLKMQHG